MSNSRNKRLAEEMDIGKVRKPAKEKFPSRDSSDSRDNSRGRKRLRSNGKFDLEIKSVKKQVEKKPVEFETDPQTLQRRQKQIDYGKNTVGYYNYTQQVPMEQRTKEHPRTPEKYTKYSRRSWDALIKVWRKQLHSYDPSAPAGTHTGATDESGDDEGTVE